MAPDDEARLVHMIDAAETVADFFRGRQRSDLDTDQMLLFALVRAIEIIREAATRVSADRRTANPNIPWADITGMRKRLVHAYFDIDRDTVWRTATEEVPFLLEALQGVSREV
ncbi:MAG: HepT-like ribonuclease domain-containing protein [Geminicoccaceae bacterium]